MKHKLAKFDYDEIGHRINTSQIFTMENIITKWVLKLGNFV